MCRQLILGLVLFGGACASSIDDRAAYWQDGACVAVAVGEGDQRGQITMCVPFVVVRKSGEMEIRVQWQRPLNSLYSIDKDSDAGNRNMYLTDDFGNRYDHVETTGSAAEKVRLNDRYPTAVGVFVFPAAHPEATSFAFHDDDQNVVIENIVLDEAAKTDLAASASVLGAIAEADTIRVRQVWFVGAGEQSIYSYRLDRDGADFTVSLEHGPRLNRMVPGATIEELVRTLEYSPLLEREYQPTRLTMHGTTTVELQFELEDRLIEFSSESEGVGMVPWKVDTFEKSFVIPDGTPARALRKLEPFLPELEIPRIDDRPEALSPTERELIEAAKNGDTARAQAVIASGVNVNKRDSYDGKTPIHLALDAGSLGTVRALLEAGAEADWFTMWEVSWNGDVAMLSVILEAGIDPDFAIRDQSETPLMIACENGHLAAARLLLESGADASAETTEGETALARASKGDSTEMVSLLLEAGAAANGSDANGETPLMSALHPDVAEVLLSAGADIHAHDRQGNPVLIRVIGGILGRQYPPAPIDSPAVVRVLLAHGADVNERDARGRTALSSAMHEGVIEWRLEMTKDLLAAGADPSAAANDGSTPLSIARAKGQTDVLALLESR